MFSFFKKCIFWDMSAKIEFEHNWRYGCMSHIMHSDQNSKYTTFPNIFSLSSANPVDLSYIQKNHFSKKNHDFLIENVL